MKLDESIAEQRLSLDITPLIDVVFLLVLFFAVTTSFISPEDLNALKSDVLGLTEEKVRLSADTVALRGEVEGYASRVAQQESAIAELEREYRSLTVDFEQTVATNEQRIAELQAAIREAETRAQNLLDAFCACLDVPVEHRRVRAQAVPVRPPGHLEPTLGADLLRVQLLPHALDQHLGAAAGQ